MLKINTAAITTELDLAIQKDHENNYDAAYTHLEKAKVLLQQTQRELTLKYRTSGLVK